MPEESKGRIMSVKEIEPIPHNTINRAIHYSLVPQSASLRYVFNVTMAGERGAVGWDADEDAMILYMPIEGIDRLHFPDLDNVEAMWVVFRLDRFDS